MDHDDPAVSRVGADIVTRMMDLGARMMAINLLSTVSPIDMLSAATMRLLPAPHILA